MKKNFWMVDILSPYYLESDFDNLIAYMVEEKEYDASSTSNPAAAFIFKQGSDLANEISKYTTPHLLELEMNDFEEGIFDDEGVTITGFFHKDTDGKIQAIPKVLFDYICRDCLRIADGDDTGVFLLEKTNNDLDYLNKFTPYTISKKIQSESNIECTCKSRNLDFRNFSLALPSHPDELLPFIDIEACHLDFENTQREYLDFKNIRINERFNIHARSILLTEIMNIKLLLDLLKNEIQIIQNENRFISKKEGSFECILSYKQYEDSTTIKNQDFISSVKIEHIAYYGFSLAEALDTIDRIEHGLKLCSARKQERYIVSYTNK